MELEGTQELVNKYLGGNTTGGNYTSSIFSDDEVEQDPLAKPSTVLGHSPLNYSSPLKTHYENLRGTSPTRPHFSQPSLSGSPVKRPYRANLDHFSFDDLNDDENVFENNDAHYAYVPGTKYSSFISTSTTKLRKLLVDEKNRNRQLSARVKELEQCLIDAEIKDSDMNLLKEELSQAKRQQSDLQAKCDALEASSQESRLAKENNLLREKLRKYKQLYEEQHELGKAAATPRTRASKQTTAEPRLECISSRGSSQEKKDSVSADDYHSTHKTRDYPSPDAASIDVKKSADAQLSMDALTQGLREIVDQMRANGNERATTKEYGDRAKENAQKPAGIESSQSATLLKDFIRVLREEMDRTNADAKSAGAREEGEEVSSRDGGKPNASEACQLDEKYLKEFAHVRQVIDRMEGQIFEMASAAERKKTTSCFRCRGVREKSGCSACTSAASQISSPPESSWAENGDGEDKTRNLMGKYTWSRTI